MQIIGGIKCKPKFWVGHGPTGPPTPQLLHALRGLVHAGDNVDFDFLSPVESTESTVQSILWTRSRQVNFVDSRFCRLIRTHWRQNR